MSLPSLPSAAAAPPPNTAAAALGAAGRSPLDITDLEPATPKKTKKVGHVKRFVKRVVLLGILGAGGWYGYQYGPDLYEQYVVKSDSINEPDAPLAFPIPLSVEPAPVRSAEFLLTDVTGAPGTNYRVTTDFETSVTRVQVTREAGPDLEVMTYGESAFVRGAGTTQWYQLDSGGFPLDGRMQRTDWVRTLDEMLPAASRGSIVIDRSTESTIETTPTRHLVVSLDPALLGTASELPLDDPAAAAASGVETVDPAVIETAPVVSDPFSAPLTGEAGEQAAQPVIGAAATQVELWIDANGLVRQISGAPQLGAETITVVTVTSEPWVPEFPAPEGVLPLTAAALIELGM